MDSLESLSRKIESAHEVATIVRTMKAVAASKINQFEMAVASLADYFTTVESGMVACIMHDKNTTVGDTPTSGKPSGRSIVIAFGSDQGMVGQFNDIMAQFLIPMIQKNGATVEVWVVGEQLRERLADTGIAVARFFRTPNSVSGITTLVGQMLVYLAQIRENANSGEVVVCHNLPQGAAAYQPASQRLLPIDQQWRSGLQQRQWPGRVVPDVAGDRAGAFLAFLSEFLFVSLYRACAESLAAENAARLAAMQRAKKSIDDLLDDLNKTYHQLRQASIDEELFDVVAGFEALKHEVRG